MTRTTPLLLLAASALALTGCPRDEPQQVPIGTLDTIAEDQDLFTDTTEGEAPSAGDADLIDEVLVGETLTDETIPELDAVEIDPETGQPLAPGEDDPDAPWDGSQVRGEDEPMEERDPQEPAPPPTLSPEELKALAAQGILKHFPGITVFTKEQRVEIQGSICLKRSPALELLACMPKGKTHESLLLLDLHPQDGPEHLATALILIGLEPTPQVNEFGEAIALAKGQRVLVEVEWAAADAPPLDASAPAPVEGRITRRAEDLIYDKRTGQAMPRVGWVFTGSRKVMVPTPPDFKTEHEVFAASYTGNIAATYHDPDCLLDTPLLEGGDDTVYVPYEGRLPERGTPAVIHMRLLDEPPADGGQGTEAPAPEAPPEDGKR
ncbi:MAG: YdjY domain-containing protein [Planctomycetota bacterium]